MLKKCTAVMVAGMLVMAVQVSHAEDRGTKKECVAIVKKAVTNYKKNGERAFVDFTAPNKAFVNKDLYITVYDMNGKCLAHGQNAKQVGKELINLKDPDGKPFIKDRIELAKTKTAFWEDQKFTDPLTKKILPKQMYCEKANAVIICSGVYKEQ